MKKYFLTGLAILLPLAVTIAIVVFILNFLTEPFLGLVTSLLDHYDLLESGFWFFNGPTLQYYGAQILILFILFGMTIWLGVIARWVFFHYFLQTAEKFVNRIPVIRTVYRTSQEVVKTIFSSQGKVFKQTVLAPFPHRDCYSIGFITNETVQSLMEENRVAVFIPTTPNPTSGFLMLMKKEDLIYLDMSVEEALKYVLSCGVIVPTFTTKTEEKAILA